MFTRRQRRIDAAVQRAERPSIRSAFCVGRWSPGRLSRSGPARRGSRRCWSRRGGGASARQLVGARVEWSPMLTRYSVAALSLFLGQGCGGRVVERPARVTGLLGQPSTRYSSAASASSSSGRCTTSSRSSSGSTDTATASASRTCRWSTTCTTPPRGGRWVACLGRRRPRERSRFATPDGTALVAGIFAFFGTLLFAGNLVAVLVAHSPQSLPTLLTGREHTPAEDS